MLDCCAWFGMIVADGGQGKGRFIGELAEPFAQSLAERKISQLVELPLDRIQTVTF